MSHGYTTTHNITQLHLPWAMQDHGNDDIATASTILNTTATILLCMYTTTYVGTIHESNQPGLINAAQIAAAYQADFCD